MGSRNFATGFLTGSGRVVATFLILFLIVNVLSAFMGLRDWHIYFVIDAVIYLAVSLFFIHLGGRIRIILSSLGIVVAIGFVVITIYKLIAIVK
jgi:hypothetical protein